ncbi:MBL fold metallo-hydrolase [Pseudohaliea rubra]|uniref:Beta-lactamase related protein n=1 Tax=Pseudohaliea rubra DSM 19751 TaxID=1265313 RepID=A0A095VTH5_9GAMM|nr:MBL fold metallo-hydrolase [Pseudohaliea rubra]KGE04393.1 Beta-lactamase related protein [Pseudohaliea rubra DSM 19751]
MTPWRRLPGGITCIDAAYVAPGIACFYLLEGDGHYALIETGTAKSLPNLRATLAALGIAREQLRYVVPTHVHLDHAGAAGLYLREFPQAELLVHPRGARHLIDPGKLTASAIGVYGEESFRELYGEIVPAPPERVRTLADGESFTVGGRRLEAIHLRGHAEHHFCLWDEATRGWFTGDMFGISYDYLRLPAGAFLLPATTPTQFDPAAYRESIHTLASRDPAWLYLTHYSALAFDPAQVALLCDQLSAYEALGDRHGDALEAALRQCTESALATLTDAGTGASLAAKLHMDLALNAQGIAWRAQQLAAAEQ